MRVLEYVKTTLSLKVQIKTFVEFKEQFQVEENGDIIQSTLILRAMKIKLLGQF